MRLKCTLKKMEQFFNIARFLDSLGKEAVFVVEKDTFCLIYKDSVSQLFAMFMARLDGLFTAFDYGGKEESVYLKFNCYELLEIMKKIKEYDECTITLTRSAITKSPCFNFKVTMDKMEITMELLLEINKHGNEFYSQPSGSDTQMEISGELHSLKRMKQALDKMSEIGDEMVFAVGQNGSIKISMETKQCKMQIVFSDKDQDEQTIFECVCGTAQVKKFFILEKLEPKFCEYHVDKGNYLIFKACVEIGDVLIYIPLKK